MEQLCFQFWEEILPKYTCEPPKPKRLYCCVCDYYFYNNPDFYKYCHICGSQYEVL